jgi:hypothetical protein
VESFEVRALEGREALQRDFHTPALFAERAPEIEGKAENPFIPVDARVAHQLALHDVAAVTAGTFQQEHVVVLHVLHPNWYRGGGMMQLRPFSFCSNLVARSITVKRTDGGLYG